MMRASRRTTEPKNEFRWKEWGQLLKKDENSRIGTLRTAGLKRGRNKANLGELLVPWHQSQQEGSQPRSNPCSMPKTPYRVVWRLAAGAMTGFRMGGSTRGLSWYFLGRPRVKWRLRKNSKSSTIQKEPKSSSYLTKHLWRDRLVRTAFCGARGSNERKREGGGEAGEKRRKLGGTKNHRKWGFGMHTPRSRKPSKQSCARSQNVVMWPKNSPLSS